MLVPALRGTKLRVVTVSGEQPREVPSTARPRKPPAKVISAHKAAAKRVGGNKTPPKMRERLADDPKPRRVHPVDHREEEQRSRTRAGKREPEAGRYARSAEMRDAWPSRRANVPAPDPGTRRYKEARVAPRRPT